MLKSLIWLAGYVDSRGSFPVETTELDNMDVPDLIFNTADTLMEWNATATIRADLAAKARLDTLLEPFNFESTSDKASGFIWYKTTSRNGAKAFIEAVLPYLRIKQKEAKNALEILSSDNIYFKEDAGFQN